MEKGGGKKQLVTLNVVAESPTFNLLSEVASQLPTTCTLYVLQVKTEIRSNQGQPNKVDLNFLCLLALIIHELQPTVG